MDNCGLPGIIKRQSDSEDDTFSESEMVSPGEGFYLRGGNYGRFSHSGGFTIFLRRAALLHERAIHVAMGIKLGLLQRHAHADAIRTRDAVPPRRSQGGRDGYHPI